MDEMIYNHEPLYSEWREKRRRELGKMKKKEMVSEVRRVIRARYPAWSDTIKKGGAMTLREKIDVYEAEHGAITDIDAMRTCLDELERRAWWEQWDWGSMRSMEDIFSGVVDTGPTCTTFAGLSRHAPDWGESDDNV